MNFPIGKAWAAAAILLAGGPAAPAESEPPEFSTNWTNLNDIARFHAEETEYLLQKKDLDGASLEVQQALSMVPDHPTLLRWAADLYTERGQYAMAESYWARLSELYPTNAWVFARWGDVFFQLDRFDRAEQALARALELDPDTLPARYQLACIHLMKGRRARAQGLLKDLPLTSVIRIADWIEIDAELLPDRMGHLAFESVVLLALGAPPAEPGAETTPDWAGRMAAVKEALTRALAARDAQQWADLRESLETAMSAGLRVPEARRDLALALYHLGEKARALDEFDRLEKEYPDFPGVQGRYGQLLLEEGRFDLAAAALEKARRQDPADTESAFALICAYAGLNRFTDARDTARPLPPRQARQIGAWIAEGHRYARHLEGNTELRDWLQSLGPQSAKTQ
ncbi:MAG: tetratricopeptide repeat protein [Kiritimatiellae bacterium]|nr:tetratricopeptide repeat protein [Kiritimatiellia bacterium]